MTSILIIAGLLLAAAFYGAWISPAGDLRIAEIPGYLACLLAGPAHRKRVRAILRHRGRQRLPQLLTHEEIRAALEPGLSERTPVPARAMSTPVEITFHPGTAAEFTTQTGIRQWHKWAAGGSSTPELSYECMVCGASSDGKSPFYHTDWCWTSSLDAPPARWQPGSDPFVTGPRA